MLLRQERAKEESSSLSLSLQIFLLGYRRYIVVITLFV